MSEACVGCHVTAETSLRYFVSAKSSPLSVWLLKVAGVGFSVHLRCMRKRNKQTLSSISNGGDKSFTGETALIKLYFWVIVKTSGE